MNLQSIVLGLHILFGFSALTSGLIAIIASKGGELHRVSGKIYFIAMTVVFISGVWVAVERDNRFLFLIAFLSYYSVFAGVRALKLKQLHRDQKPEKVDWIAGSINALANFLFLGLGLFYVFKNGFFTGGALLSIGFGLGGLAISYTNLSPFIFKPQKSWHWYLSHIGNMMGGYIATLTAFISTTVSRYGYMDPFLAFALPSLIGIPLLIYWQQKINHSFEQKTKQVQ
jgi:uncharacterized membrane protein